MLMTPSAVFIMGSCDTPTPGQTVTQSEQPLQSPVGSTTGLIPWSMKSMSFIFFQDMHIHKHRSQDKDATLQHPRRL